MNLHVIRAIFRRNFISYFSNPTGYVFICVFVLLSSIAAFYPNEFFNSNLANLDQLNRYLPYILLVFIPAITMSIWAEEKRQGTDELLLTIPAGDFDVVLGKYLAAVAIYSAALAFSLVSNFSLLSWLGVPDLGLLLATYFGYWIVGLAMIAVGMVASFLTGNLTVGFVLGALFNAPLAFASNADVIVRNSDWASRIERWSIAHQFHDFSRGVISLSSVAYFLGLVALMLYLCMVLIGRRHWRGGAEGRGVALHYLARFICLVAVVGSVDWFLSNHDSVRADMTVEGLSSLSPQTRKLIKDLDGKPPVKVYAYISNQVPENFVETRLNLLSTLSEIKALAGDKIELQIRNVDPLSDEATKAEQQFGIRPQTVEARTRGTRAPEDIFLGVAVVRGLDKVVVPFFTKGLPAEYEIVRSIATVSQQKRKKVGVLTTDAKLYGGFDMQAMSTSRNEMIIDELQKQYDVVQVDPTNPIRERYDVLLAVQPSSLGPQQMENFISAVKRGQPTAIFEDPFPFLAGDVPGTKAPKQPPGGNNMMAMMNRQPPQPKGDISRLWRALGVDFNGGDVVWQDYNPYPQIRGHMPREWVFVEEEAIPKAFNQEDPISAKLQELLFPYPGSLIGLHSSTLKFTPLVSTGSKTGVVPYDNIMIRLNPFEPPRLNPEVGASEKPTGDRYVLAARVTGKLKPENQEMSDKDPADELGEDPAAGLPDDPSMSGAGMDDVGTDPFAPPAGDPGAEGEIPHDSVHEHLHKHGEKGTVEADLPPGDGTIDVVIVTDIDLLYSAFFQLRARGAEDGDEVEWRFENVTFVLNVLDSLSGDDRFIEVRKHRPIHRTLSKVAMETEGFLKQAEENQQQYAKDFDKAKASAQSEFDGEMTRLRKRTDIDRRQQAIEIELALRHGEQKLNTEVNQLKQKRDQMIKSTQRELAQTIRRVQDHYKFWGVTLPLIPPLAVAFFVYFNRRAREREGVSKSRLRS